MLMKDPAALEMRLCDGKTLEDLLGFENKEETLQLVAELKSAICDQNLAAAFTTFFEEVDAQELEKQVGISHYICLIRSSSF